MPGSIDDEIRRQVRHADEEAILSLKQVLAGYIAHKGGPTEWGKLLAERTDPDSKGINPATQASIENNILRLLGGVMNSVGGNENEDQLVAMLAENRRRQAELAAMMQGDGKTDDCGYIDTDD